MGVVPHILLAENLVSASKLGNLIVLLITKVILLYSSNPARVGT